MPASKKAYQLAKAAGFCASCLKVQVDRAAGYLCCDGCRKKAVERARNKSRRAQKEGVCTNCLRKPPDSPRLQCVDCLSRNRSPYIAGTAPKRRLTVR